VAEITALRACGVDSVVSLLEMQEVRELELREEGSLCNAHGMEFLSFPIADRGTPDSKKDFSVFLGKLHTHLLEGRSVAIHCRAGIGRTGLVAGCLLHLLNVPYKDIFHILSRSRGVPVPDTSAQVAWVETFVQTSNNVR
jgi:protein-tyrosine phosphatase